MRDSAHPASRTTILHFINAPNVQMVPYSTNEHINAKEAVSLILQTLLRTFVPSKPHSIMTSRKLVNNVPRKNPSLTLLIRHVKIAPTIVPNITFKQEYVKLAINLNLISTRQPKNAKLVQKQLHILILESEYAKNALNKGRCTIKPYSIAQHAPVQRLFIIQRQIHVKSVLWDLLYSWTTDAKSVLKTSHFMKLSQKPVCNVRKTNQFSTCRVELVASALIKHQGIIELVKNVKHVRATSLLTQTTLKSASFRELT